MGQAVEAIGKAGKAKERVRRSDEELVAVYANGIAKSARRLGSLSKRLTLSDAQVDKLIGFMRNEVNRAANALEEPERSAKDPGFTW